MANAKSTRRRREAEENRAARAALSFVLTAARVELRGYHPGKVNAAAASVKSGKHKTRGMEHTVTTTVTAIQQSHRPTKAQWRSMATGVTSENGTGLFGDGERRPETYTFATTGRKSRPRKEGKSNTLKFTNE